MTGRVILLNGASSSGKTSIARALQARWPTPLLRFGIDDVIGMMPFKFTGNGPNAREGFLVRVGDSPETFVPGDAGYRLNAHAAQFVANLATNGFDVVLDYVFDEQLLSAFRLCLGDVPVLFCGVYCDIPELTRRERQRGDRAAGLAERQSATVHFCADSYDLSLDSGNCSADDLAASIADHLVALDERGRSRRGLR